MGEIAIGIDLGTSNSCVAVARKGGAEVLLNIFDEATTASVVAFRKDGAIDVGNAARAKIIHEPKNTVYSSKRLIGRYSFSNEVKKARAIYSYEIVEHDDHAIRVKIRDETFSLPEISAMILREMKAIAEARLGEPVSKAVLTVPAYFNDNQRQATKDAGRIAGLEVLRILNEPTAAALAYGFGRGLQQRVAVYDLGGGTFDVSILEIGSEVFEVLATAGDTFLGGDDFDDRLIDLLADEFQAQHGVNLRNDRYALEKLKVAAENAKKALSVDSEVEIDIPEIVDDPRRPLGLKRRITSQEFGGLVSDLMQRTFKVCDEALQQANVVSRDLDGVVLVGGPTRLPIVREAVRTYFQQEPTAGVDPDQVVAIGAAIHASALVAPQGEAILLDVTPLSLRIGVAGGLAETVIERNTPVPIEQTRTFTTFRDFQESVSIRVYQGESREAAENEQLGEFEFSGFRKARRGEVEIDVTFEINAEGIVSVTACDRATGQAASTRIRLSSGLSEQEIQEILKRDRTSRVEQSGPPNLVERMRAPSPAPAPALPETEPADAAPALAQELEPVTEELPRGPEPAGASAPEPPLAAPPLPTGPRGTAVREEAPTREIEIPDLRAAPTPVEVEIDDADLVDLTDEIAIDVDATDELCAEPGGEALPEEPDRELFDASAEAELTPEDEEPS